MFRRSSTSWLLVPVLSATLVLVGGCDGLGWLNIYFVIPLGISDTPGMLNGFGDGSIFVPPPSELDPPLPVQIGEPPGGSDPGIANP